MRPADASIGTPQRRAPLELLQRRHGILVVLVFIISVQIGLGRRQQDKVDVLQDHHGDAGAKGEILLEVTSAPERQAREKQDYGGGGYRHANGTAG